MKVKPILPVYQIANFDEPHGIVGGHGVEDAVLEDGPPDRKHRRDSDRRYQRNWIYARPLPAE
jgi:hypothetical protein